MAIAGQFGIGGAGAVYGRGTTRRPGGPSGFALPGDAPPAVHAGAPVMLPSLLDLQESEGDAARDRDAREHGEALLHVLSALQRALLGGGDPAAVERLAALVRRAPLPADPRLLSVQRALLVRAAVELARARVAASA